MEMQLPYFADRVDQSGGLYYAGNGKYHWLDRYFASLQTALDAKGTPAEEVHCKLVDLYWRMHNFARFPGEALIPHGLAERWMNAGSAEERAALRQLVDLGGAYAIDQSN